MSQSINLIPQEEKKEQRKERIVKLSSVLSILLLVVVVCISGYYWYQKSQINKAIDAQDMNIEKSRNDITSLSEIEVVARELDAKYVVLDSFFDARYKYSILMEELQKRVPADTVAVVNFTLVGDDRSAISLSGTGLDYISIARFIDTLSDQNFPGVRPGFEKLFTNVTLNSVNLDNQDLSVTYFIVVDYDPTLLTE